MPPPAINRRLLETPVEPVAVRHARRRLPSHRPDSRVPIAPTASSGNGLAVRGRLFVPVADGSVLGAVLLSVVGVELDGSVVLDGFVALGVVVWFA